MSIRPRRDNPIGKVKKLSERAALQIDNLFELFFGSLYDRIILKIKRQRARLILRSSSKEVEGICIKILK